MLRRKKHSLFIVEGRSGNSLSELVAKKKDEETRQRNSFKWFLRAIKYSFELEFYLLIPSKAANMSAAIKSNSQNTHILLSLISVLKQHIRGYFKLKCPSAANKTYRTYKQSEELHYSVVLLYT